MTVVTKQLGIRRGYFDYKAVRGAHERMFALLKQSGVNFEGAYHCPHLMQNGCRCRSPRVTGGASAELGREKESPYLLRRR